MSEQLVNEHFNDFPIDYFKVRPIDFESIIQTRGFESATQANEFINNFLENNPVSTIALNEEGFIGKALNDLIDYSQKDTTIINCAVGQGKTTAILNNLKKQYYENPDLYFIIAVPYVSLIEQYERDLINIGIHPDHIFNYSKLGSKIEDGGEDYLQLNRRFHIVTANSLLGNPGENALMQSEPKHKYLKKFPSLLEENNKKAVLVFDEIHDTVHNFSSIGIIHLFFWEKVLIKIIAISATFNAPSIAVLSLFTKLTNNKFKIIESERKVVRPQSKLFLHFDNGKYNSENHTILSTVDRLLEENKNIDIITYSKKLAKQLLNKNNDVGKKLTERFGELRDCTSNLQFNLPDDEDEDEDEATNKFDNNSCNIGTNFKTGVSIVKENHALIVILPPSTARRSYNSNNGIFTDGINSIIQTLARQRTSGEIHIILPSPIELDEASLNHMSSLQVEAFTDVYKQISIPSISIQTRNNVKIRPNRYIPFEEHIDIIREKYQKQATRIFQPIISAQKHSIHFQSFEEFLLKSGNLALVQEGFLGRDLSSYVTYCAFTNQFYNARLEGVSFSPSYELDKINEKLLLTYNEYIHQNGGALFSENISKPISVKYKYLRNKLINNTNARFGDPDKKKIRLTIFKFLVNLSNSQNSDNLSFIYIMDEYNNLSNSSDEEKQFIISKLREYITKFKNSIFTENGVRYFKKYGDIQIFENDKTDIFQLVKLIKKKNDALKLSGAKFFRESNEETIGKDLYKYLIKALYKTIRYQPQGNDYLRIEREIFSSQNL